MSRMAGDGDDDLDLLLSLQDRVPETPPQSPTHGYLSDDGSARPRGTADMSVFRTAVEDCLDYQPETSKNKNLKSTSSRAKTTSNDHVEHFSGLKIRTLLSGDTLSGCWATAGVLCEKGEKRISSTGKPYAIWQIGCLDEKLISVFLFGNAYQKNCNEEIGTVFALFNCDVRKNAKSKEGYTLTVFNAPQVLKMGTSADFGTCKSCSQVINKSRGIHCKYHKKNAPDKYSSKRGEFMGGNLRMAFNAKEKMQSEGIYMVDRTNVTKPGQPKKVLSVEGLRKALSNAGKVTTNEYSQGIRFLSEVAGKPSSSLKQPVKNSDKRKSSGEGSNLPEVKTTQQLNAKRIKIEKSQTPAAKTKESTEKMVELEILSSDDEF
ncbi:Zinc finger, Mcm10/DnaG-type [Artemisia annua]|uniref:Zinc finger, Mcm10/DnaG-type n=1 Tax=Artemisia annua TaxID=35608 RepID=A0A2U1PL85_ARTAN|nr:Zinc finger, Mcm10/DnaG-type [Artemisia annua]